MFISFLRAHSGLCNRKKRNKQTILNIKNGEIVSFYKIFFRNLNSFSILAEVRENHRQHHNIKQ